MRRASKRQLGVSILEVVMSISITATVVMAAAAVTQTSVQSNAGIGTASGLSIRCSEAADIVAKQLMSAGLLAEDANGNGAMDANEDTNRNGVFDCNWSLAQGSTASTLTFNTIENSSGYYWSSAKTLSVVNGVLRLTQGTAIREICRNVSSISFSRNGDLIDFTLTLAAQDRNARTWTASAKRRINARN